MLIDSAIKKLGKVLREAGIHFGGNATAAEVFSAHRIKDPVDIATIVKLAKNSSILDLALLRHNTAKEIQTGNLSHEEKEAKRKFARQLTVAQELKSIKADLDDVITEPSKVAVTAKTPVAGKVNKEPRANNRVRVR